LAAAAFNTFTASAVTSGPVPSPGITAILYVAISTFLFPFSIYASVFYAGLKPVN
jgi:hypothetical protein